MQRSPLIEVWHTLQSCFYFYFARGCAFFSVPSVASRDLFFGKIAFNNLFQEDEIIPGGYEEKLMAKSVCGVTYRVLGIFCQVVFGARQLISQTVIALTN